MSMARAVTEVAKALEEGITNLGALPDALSKIEAIKHQIDEEAHTVLVKMAKTFITPIEHEDARRLSILLQRLVHLAADTAFGGVSFHLKGSRKQAIQLCQVFVACACDIELATRDLPRQEGLIEYRQKIKVYEEEADRLWYEGTSVLFGEDLDALQMMAWKEVLDRLEHTLDVCDDVGTVLEAIRVKHA